MPRSLHLLGLSTALFITLLSTPYSLAQSVTQQVRTGESPVASAALARNGYDGELVSFDVPTLLRGRPLTFSLLSPDGPMDVILAQESTSVLGVLNAEVLSGEVALYGEVGDIRLTVHGSTIYGRISVGGQTYMVEYVADDVHVVRRIQSDAEPGQIECDTSAPEPIGIINNGYTTDIILHSDELSVSTGGSIVDVVFVYTAAARQREGGRNSIENKIASVVSDFNNALSRTGVNHRLRVAHAGEIDFTSSGDQLTDILSLINPDDNNGDEAQVLRELYGGDLVHLIQTNETPVCGRSRIMESVGPQFAPAAYSFSEGGSCFDQWTPGHEIGHNLGLRHDFAADDDNQPFPWAHGWVSLQGQFRTLMGTTASSPQNGRCDRESDCPRINVLSNPDDRVNGSPAGLNNIADNARVVQQTMPVAEDFRDERNGGGDDDGPDLIVSELSLSESLGSPGTSVDIDATVENMGDEVAETSTLRYYFSSDQTVDAGDIEIDDDGVRELDPGEDDTESDLFQIPNRSPGLYYVIAVADADDDVDEAVETNNVRSVSFTVTTPVSSEEYVSGEWSLAAVPNPNPVDIALSVPDSRAISVEVLSVDGRRVGILFNGTATPGTMKLNLGGLDLAPGVYVVRVQSEMSDLRSRFTIVR